MANILGRVDILLSSHWTVLIEGGHARTYRDRLFSQIQNYNLTTGAAQLLESHPQGWTATQVVDWLLAV